MRIAAVSDLHGHLPKVPPCDVLVVAGDLGPSTRDYHRDKEFGHRWLLFDFIPWFRTRPANHVVLIAGNHDFLLQEGGFPAADAYPYFHYLEDSGCEIEGVKFWGSPWTPEYNGWAFMKPDNDLASKWEMIPCDTDVLVTHGPPYGCADVWGGESVGSRSLLRHLSHAKRKPRMHFFGHIHAGGGQSGPGWANVAHLNNDYEPANEVRCFDV